MMRDNEMMLDSVRQRSDELLDGLENEQPLLGLYIDCAGRCSAFSGAETEEASVLQDYVRQFFGAPFFHWFYHRNSGFALVLGNALEEPHLHPKFRDDERDVVEGVMGAFVDRLARHRAEQCRPSVHDDIAPAETPVMPAHGKESGQSMARILMVEDKRKSCLRR